MTEGGVAQLADPPQGFDERVGLLDGLLLYFGNGGGCWARADRSLVWAEVEVGRSGDIQSYQACRNRKRWFFGLETAWGRSTPGQHEAGRPSLWDDFGVGARLHDPALVEPV